MSNYLSEIYGEGGIYAKCVAASICNDIPIYTIETCAPKFIDAEFEKHRMLSSNSSSSRAIPYKELDDIYLPFDVRYNQNGMQGSKSASNVDKALFCSSVKELYDYVNSQIWPWTTGCNPIHKQHLNRYVDPWVYQKKVVTATEWDNFFKLRLATDAQPEIQELAKCIRNAMELTDPIKLSPGEWHLPYVRDYNIFQNFEMALKTSVARCARVSYNNHGNTESVLAKDIELADRLLSSRHMTPFEHQATPMKYNQCDDYYNYYDDFRTITGEWENGVTHVDKNDTYWSANLRGWIQYRQTL